MTEGEGSEFAEKFNNVFPPKGASGVFCMGDVTVMIQFVLGKADPRYIGMVVELI